MNKSVLLAGVFAATIIGAGAAQADATITFDAPVVLSNTETPGAWYTDRFNPAGFAASGGVLHEVISGGDLQANTFLNTQGRKLDLGAGATSISVDLFVSESFAGSNQRDAGFWGTGVDGGGVEAYPIIELSDLGGQLIFRGWDTLNGGWNTIASASGLTNTWQTLTISLDTNLDLFTYTAGGSSITAAGNGSTSISNAMLQGYNTGATYGISWDNLASNGAAVPEPASWALMILGFGGVGAALRRRQVRSAVA